LGGVLFPVSCLTGYTSGTPPEFTISNADEPQTLKASGTYELPIGPGKKYVNNHLLENLVGGWQVGWILD